MTSKLTRERLQEIAEDGFLKHGESKVLARMALSAMDSEPVAYTDEEELNFVNDMACMWTKGMGINEVPLYRHAQPAPKRDQVRNEHAEWSQATFGNVGPIGPLKHLSKEALEAAAEPGDLSEWADTQFLLWDAQRRAGITDEQITQAMIEKLSVNKQRDWPEPKDGEPRLHIKEQMAPVTQQEPIAWLNDAYLARGVVDGEAGSEDAGPGYIPVYREAGPQPAPVVPDDLLSMAASAIEDLLEHTDPNTSYYSGVWADVPGKLRAAMLQAGNSPVIPGGSVIGWIRTDYQQDFQVNCTAPQFVMGSSDPSSAWGVQYMPVTKTDGQQNAQQNIPEIIPGWIPVSEGCQNAEIISLQMVVTSMYRHLMASSFTPALCGRTK